MCHSFSQIFKLHLVLSSSNNDQIDNLLKKVKYILVRYQVLFVENYLTNNFNLKNLHISERVSIYFLFRC